jgi:glycine/D-amino acid oxidase-like deaminating enzyme
MAYTADIVVIGGGSTGTSIAWQLAESGFRVILIEKDRLAAGATGHSPGVVRHFYASRELGTMALASLALFERWRRDVGDAFSYRRIGVATGIPMADEEHAQAMVNAYREIGSSVELIEPAAMSRRYGDFQSEGLSCVVHEPDAGYCDAASLTIAMAEKASGAGALILENVGVEKICVSDGKINGVETNAGVIHCPCVVNAAGAWAHLLADACLAPIPIEVTRQCVAEVKVDIDERGSPVLAYTDTMCEFYMRPTERGTYLVGSHDHCDAKVIDARTFVRSEKMEEPDILRFAARVGRRFSRFGASVAKGSRVSVFDNSPDGNPIVGADPRVDGLFLAAGLSGHGFKFCPLFGQVITALIRGDHLATNIDSLSVKRFL